MQQPIDHLLIIEIAIKSEPANNSDNHSLYAFGKLLTRLLVISQAQLF